ncbi:MAG: Stp1/IreP family PP2C-type Ser/Thr phosphatase [Clostridia bacterium]|nr:Stp1/IreP family PP2C-type Ser/Thr phosphatase [Clostridia bacterium]
MKAFVKTHVGLVREQNEDTVLADAARGIFILADGMGGHKAGEVASDMAARAVQGVLEEGEFSPVRLRAAISAANRAVYERQLDDEALSGMGTTLTVLWVRGERALLGHVGDSRAYLYLDGRLRQISEDHSVVGEMVRAGALSEEQARTHPYRNVITRAVGTDASVRADVAEYLLTPGSRWLLCSDGLTDMATDEEISRTLNALSGEAAAQRLVELALMNGGRDNVSLILLEVEA